MAAPGRCQRASASSGMDTQVGRLRALVDGLVDGLVGDVGVEQACSSSVRSPTGVRRQEVRRGCGRAHSAGAEGQLVVRWPGVVTARSCARRPGRRSRRSAACPATSRHGESGSSRSASGLAGSPSKSTIFQPAHGAQRLAEVQVAVDLLDVQSPERSAAGRTTPAAPRRAPRARVRPAAPASSRALICVGERRCRRAASPAAKLLGERLRAPRAAPRRAGPTRRRSRRRPRAACRSASAKRLRTLASARSQPSLAVRRNCCSIASCSRAAAAPSTSTQP